MGGKTVDSKSNITNISHSYFLHNDRISNLTTAQSPGSKPNLTQDYLCQIENCSTTAKYKNGNLKTYHLRGTFFNKMT